MFSDWGASLASPACFSWVGSKVRVNPVCAQLQSLVSNPLKEASAHDRHAYDFKPHPGQNIKDFVLVKFKASSKMQLEHVSSMDWAWKISLFIQLTCGM